MSYLPVALGTSLVHEIDWADAVPEGASISSSSWVLRPTGKGVTLETPSRDGKLTQVNIEVDDEASIGPYVITNLAVFSDGSTDARSFSIRVCHETEAA